jgi:hypothetical protein
MCHLASGTAQGVTYIRHNFKFCGFTVPKKHTVTLFKVTGNSKNMYCASKVTMLTITMHVKEFTKQFF